MKTYAYVITLVRETSFSSGPVIETHRNWSASAISFSNAIDAMVALLIGQHEGYDIISCGDEETEMLNNEGHEYLHSLIADKVSEFINKQDISMSDSLVIKLRNKHLYNSAISITLMKFGE